jgi:hypothetical protein
MARHGRPCRATSGRRRAQHGRFAKLQRQDVEAINLAPETELARRGMVVNHADTASIRARLGDFFALARRFDPVWARPAPRLAQPRLPQLPPHQLR